MFRKLISLVVVALLLAVYLVPASVHAQDGTDTPAPVPTEEVVEAVTAAIESGQLDILVIGQQPPFTNATSPDAEAGTPLHEQAKDVVSLAAWGVAFLLLLVFAVIVLAFAGVILKWALSGYLNVDQRLATFGNTPTGRLVYSGLGTAETYIDSPDDPFIQQGTALANSIVQQALGIFQTVLPVKADLLTPEEVSQAAKTTLAGIRELFDGIPLPDGISADDLFDHLKGQG